MPLKVIGAGFGRTGTLSLKLALEQLGFGPCYHMVEVFKHDAASLWVDASEGRPDWERIFDGYNSTVDWPSATYWRELAEAYPDAKVILTERDAEAWFASTQATIFPHETPPDDDVPFNRMFRQVIGRLFDQRMREHDHVIDVYRRHNAEVKASLPPERLLVYEVAQGWGPLCEFLDVPVPAEPMPNVNTTEEFRLRRADRVRPLEDKPQPAG
jgi:hypothetical protein